MATDVNRNVEEGRDGGSEEESEERGAEGEVVEVARRVVVGSGGPRSIPTVRSLEDKKHCAEILWVLKMVNSGFSYNSTEDLVPVLQMMAPDSLILKSLQMKKTKAMYVLCHGLYPYYIAQLVRRIQKAPGFTLGTVSGTFKLHGLAKVVELCIRSKQKKRKSF